MSEHPLCPTCGKPIQAIVEAMPHVLASLEQAKLDFLLREERAPTTMSTTLNALCDCGELVVYENGNVRVMTASDILRLPAELRYQLTGAWMMMEARHGGSNT